MGIEQLKKLVETIAEGINVGFKLFNKAGIFAIFELSDDLSALASLSKDELVAQFKDLTVEERKELNALFKSKLVLSDKTLEAKIEESADCLEQAVALVHDGVVTGTAFYKSGKELYEKAKAILS